MSHQPQPEMLASSVALTAALDGVCRALAAAREQERWLEARLTAPDLGSSEFLLLWKIARAGNSGEPQHALAERVGLSRPQASVLLEKLRRAGWLVSVRAANDRRKQLWELTAAGREKLETMLADMVAPEKTQGEYSVGLEDAA